MGQQLDTGACTVNELLPLQFGGGVPFTEKDSSNGRCDTSQLFWGYSCMQGWRENMEDAHIANAQPFPERLGFTNGWGETAVFAVMDGHGGEQVARFCELHLLQEISQHPAWDAVGALRAAFHRMDELLADPRSLQMLVSLSKPQPLPRPVDPHMMGSTAVVGCVRPKCIVVANAGDSRAVLCRKGLAINMSEDHKPNLPGEYHRIEKAGGCVLTQQHGPHVLARVNGDLSLSRAIGDLRYKTNPQLRPEQQIICSTPDVRVFKREPTDEFMVLACDGIWDVLSSQQVVDFIRPRLMSGMAPSVIAEGLLDACLSPNPKQTFGIGCDNMTIVIVAFLGAFGAGVAESGPPATPTRVLNGNTNSPERGPPRGACRQSHGSFCGVPAPSYALLPGVHGDVLVQGGAGHQLRL